MVVQVPAIPAWKEKVRILVIVALVSIDPPGQTSFVSFIKPWMNWDDLPTYGALRPLRVSFVCKRRDRVRNSFSYNFLISNFMIFQGNLVKYSVGAPSYVKYNIHHY